MAFTETDLTSVETAIKAIAAGTRVVEVTVAAKTTRYQAPQIEALLKLRDTIKSDLVASGAGGSWNKAGFGSVL
jgi:hypothetical protein